MMEVRDSEHALEASGPLSAELDGALAKLRERFPKSSLKVARSGDAWGDRAVGGRFVATALYHLVDNAERFHRPGGPVNVTVDATREGDVLKLTVQDEGRGFSPGQDGYAAARFSEPGRVSGVGLGLATVRLVAERAGGSLQLMNSDAPRGARVVLRLRGAP
jgi:signal transduction histidine kinase